MLRSVLGSVCSGTSWARIGIAAEHLLRRLMAQPDWVLAEMGPQFEAMYASMGRPSIALARSRKATLLIAFYSVRSERRFRETLHYNMLFRTFLDMNLEERSFEQSTFSRTGQG